MNKKIFRALQIFLFSVMILVICTTLSNASALDPVNPTDPGTKDFKGPMDIIIGIAQVIATGFAAIMLIVLGIKYVSSAPNDKAEIKKHAVVYIVGAVIAFAASGIVQIIKVFANEVFN